MPIFWAETVGCLMSAFSSSTYSAARARTCSSKGAKVDTLEGYLYVGTVVVRVLLLPSSQRGENGVTSIQRCWQR